MKRTRTALCLLPVCLLLATAAPGARANGLESAIGHAVINKMTGGHEFQFNVSDSYKQLVIIPEPNTGALMALGGLVGLAAWRLRRRSIENRVSSARQ